MDDYRTGYIDGVESRDMEVATLNEHIEYMLSRDKTWADIDSLKEQQLASRDAEIAELRQTIATLREQLAAANTLIRAYREEFGKAGVSWKIAATEQP